MVLETQGDKNADNRRDIRIFDKQKKNKNSVMEDISYFNSAFILIDISLNIVISYYAEFMTR